ncbi:DUF1830 domain-containing protein [Phormidium sp. CCY1219]|uniref:DUF1830 domain-containing protein n=1 Tax=Phormidium sp. CCY1219 TaxID=2886104 RepID=UPI002D1E5579|nr:DUF1830 domain-containing protein [Phormidium sp. CCY1219]MEB3831246.1 DUF1830 domain-containing protein [Phormidium sp. CCY1219]
MESVASKTGKRVLCYFANPTSNIVILRSGHQKSQNFERIVFPGERLFFEASSRDSLEVYQSGSSGLDLVETMRCDRLQVNADRHSPQKLAA